MSDKIFNSYINLRDEIDKECEKLWEMHKGHMKCSKGCSFCCQAFRILPLELHFIQEKLKSEKVFTNKIARPDECKFLIDNKCTIYEHRPVICRTHGFPLVRLNEETEAYEVSFCELNFKNVKLELFDTDNVFQEDIYNSKLYMLNKQFIEQYSEIEYDSLQLLELNDIIVNKV